MYHRIISMMKRAAAAVTNTVTWAASGGAAAGTGGALSSPWPAGKAVGDLAILYVGMKPTASGGGSVTTPLGWTLLGSIKGSTQGSTSGLDNGDINGFVFSKVLNGTNEVTNLSVSLSGQNVSVVRMHLLTKSGGTWDVAAATGEQSGTGNVSVTATSDPGVQAGDYLLCYKVSTTDVNTGSAYSSGAFVQSGVTFGALTQHNSNAAFNSGGCSTSGGNNLGGCIHGAAVTAGSSAGNPQFTATVSGSAHGPGPAIFIRVRAV